MRNRRFDRASFREQRRAYGEQLKEVAGTSQYRSVRSEEPLTEWRGLPALTRGEALGCYRTQRRLEHPAGGAG